MLLVETKTDPETLKVLREIRDAIRSIGENVMALKEELQALIDSMNVATNKIADEITGLKAQIATMLANPNNVSAADAANLEDQFQAIATKLTALGADPSNPVPGSTPPPTTTPAPTPTT